jgi:glycosyltransferase involved in cell wall biosynthesis
MARGSKGLSLRLVCVATLIPRKGHELLLRALAKIPHRDWRLTCAGSLALDPATAGRLVALTRELRLDDRVSLVGELDATGVADCYDSADLFVLATLQETYGMSVAEALARGLPVVSTATGAIPWLVGTEAGVLVPPGNLEAFEVALTRVLGDAGLRARLAEGARRVRERLPTWDAAAARMSAALAPLAGPLRGTRAASDSHG